MRISSGDSEKETKKEIRTEDPAAMVYVCVFPPLAPPSLHLMSLDVTDKTGEFMFEFWRTYWYAPVVWPPAMRLVNLSVE